MARCPGRRQQRRNSSNSALRMILVGAAALAGIRL
jgi:hypothetical protein